MTKSIKIKLILISLTPVTIIINLFSRRYPQVVEKYYSSFINKFLREAINSVSGSFSFSLGEILFYLLAAVLSLLIIKVVYSAFKGKFINSILSLGAYISILYVAFMLLWGFNYNRMPLNKILNISIEKSTVEELYSLCEDLALRANTVREKIQESPDGVAILPKGYKDIFDRASLGYNEAAKINKAFDGNYGRPKGILSSPVMSYTGITGIYIPYTGEANVNFNSPEFMLPSTTTHEMAHQRGFAREDEANYIAYLTCILHPHDDFKYSGIMLALIHSMNALGNKDIKYYKEIKSKLSPGVIRDLNYQNQFWERYEGKAEEISNNINNNYLKSNGQRDGVESYGRMVDLLLAEHKYKNNK